MIDIKKCISNGAQVNFEYYRDGCLWYKTVEGDIFPVPTSSSEIGNATFLKQDKAILFQRYMRKWNQKNA